ncbi:hypothetical protein ABZS29_20985 [Kribbella sp. NPDC005582]|uniref:hypothetical protein n=1 Tax=Kribbella sp. NPDC005582 TaxID=3156893 RepID=UPI0033B0C2CC
MSIATAESEARNWATDLVPAAPPRGQAHAKLVLDKPGFVEIKPHTRSGIRSGLTQLARRLKKANLTCGVLATYLGVGPGAAPVKKGKARFVRIYAVLVDLTVTPTPTVLQYSRPAQWHYLGLAPLPDKLEHPPVDHAPAFGWAVEPVVQRQVMNIVTLKTPKKTWTPLGGPGHAPDLMYTELADFYRELANELRDPLYAELAAELEAMAA